MALVFADCLLIANCLLLIMKTPAAILVDLAAPLPIVDLDVPPLKPGQVLVEIAFSGVCHTQLGEVRGLRGPDPFLPHCLGHEASGWVRELVAGRDAGRRWPGCDSFLDQRGRGERARHNLFLAGQERQCRRGDHFLSFQRGQRKSPHAACRRIFRCARRPCWVVPCRPAIGAVLNTAGARPGQSLAVFGVGGVGCCAVAGAFLSGCHPIIAVDVNPWKLELARQFGASHTVLAEDETVVDKVMQIAQGQLDFAVEVSGRPSVMRQALRAVRPQGGIAVVVGNARHGEKLEIDPRWLNNGKQLRGSWGGDNLPERDFPRYQRLVTAGPIAARSAAGQVVSAGADQSSFTGSGARHRSPAAPGYVSLSFKCSVFSELKLKTEHFISYGSNVGGGNTGIVWACTGKSGMVKSTNLAVPGVI